MDTDRVGKWLKVQAVGWFFGTVLTACGAVLYRWMSKGGNRPDDFVILGTMTLVGVGLLGLVVVFVSHLVLSTIAVPSARESFRFTIVFWIAAMAARVARRFFAGFWVLLPIPLAFYSLRSLLQAHQFLENSIAGEGLTFENHLNHHRRVFLGFFIAFIAIGMLGLPWAARDLLVEVLGGAVVTAILLMETSLAKAMWRLGNRMQAE